MGQNENNGMLPYDRDRPPSDHPHVPWRSIRSRRRTVALIQSRKSKTASMTEVLTTGSHVDC
jgi:hypothetical protein